MAINQQFKVVAIPPGTSLRAIISLLGSELVLRNPLSTMLFFRVFSEGMIFVSGFYDIFPGANTYDVLRRIKAGKVAKRKVTIEPGSSKYKIVAKINRQEGLLGHIGEDLLEAIEEGLFFPETYVFNYGMKSEELLILAQEKMISFVNKAWIARSAGCILKSPREALILASIVEKEARNLQDIQNIASVFMNRLRKGMRLQSDVTSSYGIDFGRGKFRAPSSQELKRQHEFNTYQNNGLPPNPITNPGASAILAVTNPPVTEYLFFFSDKTGKTYFSKNFGEHNKAIRRTFS